MDNANKKAVVRSIQRLMAIEANDELRAALPDLVAAMEGYPTFAPGWHLLGTLEGRLGNDEAAEQYLQKARALDPENETLCRDHGRSLYMLKRYKEAIALLEPLMARHPEDHLVRFLLGMSFSNIDRVPAAERVLGELPATADLSTGHWQEIGSFFLRQAVDYAKSGAALKEAVRLDPDNFRARNELAWHFVAVFEFKKAAAEFLKAVELADRPWLYYSNYLFVLTYYFHLMPGDLLQKHQGWDSTCRPARPVRLAKRRTQDRRLKIGYVSGDFRQHVVWNFIEPVIRRHNRERVSVHCFHNWNKSDPFTEHLRSLADSWTDTHSMESEALSEQIRASKIDVLVDLSGHSKGNRMDVFAQRCAPLQVTYLGYIATTGLAEMDVRISDEILTPSETKEYFSERIWRLPRCYKAYQAFESGPEIQSRAGSRDLIFGSLHRLQKITGQTIDLWAGILSAVPKAKLLIARHELRSPANQRALLERLQAGGISSSRLILRGSWQGSHLTIYNEIDIALDTFPVTGGATTAEALWMGVPVLTRAGQMTRERISASILHGLGRPDWVVNSKEELMQAALSLAEEVRQPGFSKKVLRQHLVESDLGDGASLAASLEDAYFALQ